MRRDGDVIIIPFENRIVQKSGGAAAAYSMQRLWLWEKAAAAACSYHVSNAKKQLICKLWYSYWLLWQSTQMSVYS